MRIVDHFEDPKGIIRNISDEEQRAPEKLASALKINLSYIYFKAGDNNFFEIPVRSLSPLEHRGYMVFWRSKNLDRARQLVQTASDFLTSETIPGADFLKFLRIADRYPTAEAAQKIFNGINKADIDNDPEKLASTLDMHLSYYVLKFQGLNDVEIPTTELTAEEIQQYQGFFSLIPPQKAIQLIDAAKTRVTTSLISGTDFLKFIKIIDRFASIKAAEEAISGVATEIQNDPEKLARAFGFDLSHQIMRIPGQAPVEMPVQALTRTEVHAYQNFMGRQEMELIPGLITTARGMLTVSDVTAETFLKFMRVFERFPTIEAAQQELNRLAAERFPTIQAEEAFNRLVKEEIDNDPEKLAKAFAFELSHMFIKFPKVGSIELPIDVTMLPKEAMLYKNFVESFSATIQENFDRVKSLVELAKSVLTAPTVTATSFYKFLQLSQELETVEGIKEVFLSVPKEDIQDNADALAFTLLRLSTNESIENGCRSYFVKELERGAYSSDAANLELLEIALGKDDSHVKTFATLVEQAAEKAKTAAEEEVTEYS